MKPSTSTTSTTNEIVIRVILESGANPPAPEPEFEEVGERSPSQKLRLKLLTLYNFKAPEEPFEIWYKQQIDRFIEVVERGMK